MPHHAVHVRSDHRTLQLSEDQWLTLCRLALERNLTPTELSCARDSSRTTPTADPRWTVPSNQPRTPRLPRTTQERHRRRPERKKDLDDERAAAHPRRPGRQRPRTHRPSEDLRGWLVVDRAGEDVGHVDGLLVERRGTARTVPPGRLRRVPRAGQEDRLIPTNAVVEVEEQVVAVDTTRDLVASAPAYDPALEVAAGRTLSAEANGCVASIANRAVTPPREGSHG